MVNFLFAVVFLVLFLFFAWRGMSSAGFQISKIKAFFFEFSREETVKELPSKSSEVQSNDPAPSPGVVSSSSTPFTQGSVRPLEQLEMDKLIKNLPDGIYGYSHPWRIEGNYATPGEINLTAYHNNFFEIQKVAGSLYLVAYISEESFAKIGTIKPTKPQELVLAGVPWDIFKKAVAVPLKSINSVSVREIPQKLGLDKRILDVVLTNIAPALSFHPAGK